jgi:hypothetical protein
VRFQSTQSSCGPAALRTALLARRIVRSEDELAKLAGCTPADGTSPRGLLRALRLISQEHPAVTPGVLNERRADVAILRLTAALQNGTVALLCVDQWSHWVTAFGLLGHTVHVADSADNEMVLHYEPSEILTRWRGPGGGFYGILV